MRNRSELLFPASISFHFFNLTPIGNGEQEQQQ